MRRNNYKKNIIFIVILFVVIFGMSISYALLSKNLNVNFGSVTMNSYNFDVGFNTSSYAIYPGDGFTDCGSLNVTKSTVTVSNVKLHAGSMCTYRLSLKNFSRLDSNNEGIGAYLTSITNLYPSNYTCSNISSSRFICSVNSSSVLYFLCTDNNCNNTLDTGITLAAGSSRNVFFRIQASSNFITSEATLSGGGFRVSFNAV